MEPGKFTLRDLEPGKFTLRDFLHYVLPALLVVCLYVPLIMWGFSIGPEWIILGAVFLSFLLQSSMYRLAQWLYEQFPLTRARTRKAFAAAQETEGRWDAKKLHTLLTEDERERLYLHGSYAALYAVLGLYLFIYVMINLFLLSRAASYAFAAAAGRGWLAAIVAAVQGGWSGRTPFVGSLHVNTLFLLTASVVLFYFSYKQYIRYYELLTQKGGHYDRLAAEHLKEDERPKPVCAPTMLLLVRVPRRSVRRLVRRV